MVEALDTNPDSLRRSGILRRFRAYLSGIVRSAKNRVSFAGTSIRARGATLCGGVIGAELQHYQDPEQVDLTVAMQGVVDQLVVWLTRGSRGQR